MNVIPQISSKLQPRARHGAQRSWRRRLEILALAKTRIQATAGMKTATRIGTTIKFRATTRDITYTISLGGIMSSGSSPEISSCQAWNLLCSAFVALSSATAIMSAFISGLPPRQALDIESAIGLWLACSDIIGLRRLPAIKADARRQFWPLRGLLLHGTDWLCHRNLLVLYQSL